ncbi:unnamed protein product [Pedinophyceae sp. YPF-701]|nr:unnamed protein product [Pedinophyceae sp. YPF-701]
MSDKAQEIIQQFQQMNQNFQTLAQKLNEMEADLQEHGQVLKVLAPMDKERKCCRLVSGVLVERTVGEVMPAVQKNHDMIQGAVAKFKEQLDAKRKEIAAFQTKHKIRIKGQDDGPQQKEGEGKGGGVLV